MLVGAYEIEGGTPLRGRVRISGSKNASLPIMAAALLGDGPTVLRNVPSLRDTMQMQALLSLLGANVDYDGSTMRIDPAGFRGTEVPFEIMNSMRASFYAAGPMLAKLGRANLSEPGGCAIGERPIDLHIAGFEALGATSSSRDGYVKLRHRGLAGARMSLCGKFGTSVGATCNVLMAAVLSEGFTTIEGAAREPEVSELCRFLVTMGARIEGAGTNTIHVQGVRSLRGVEYRIPPDRIEAGTWAVAALITDGELLLDGIDTSACEPTLTYLRQWGALLEQTGTSALRIRASLRPKNTLNLTTAPFPGFATDMQSAMTALLAITPGRSIIRETIYPERMMHLGQLNRMGANLRADSGVITIEGQRGYTGAEVEATDLRAGAALVLAALAAKGATLVRNTHFVERGYEDFVSKLTAVDATIRAVECEAPEKVALKETAPTTIQV